LDRQSLLTIYQSDPVFQTLALRLAAAEKFKLQVRGLSGSLDMVLLASYFEKKGGFHLVIAQDKEEAAYLNSDLQNLLHTEDYLVFPGSFKRPYQYDEVDNANVLTRAEILNQILETHGKSRVVITYPEALYQQAISS
jgi:transcription-repair coupling factor (superfamily II helicase)